MIAKNLVHASMFLVATFAVTGTLAANEPSTTQPTRVDYTRPLSFEPNRGQTDKEVDFVAHGAGYRLFLSHGDAVIVLEHRNNAKPGSHARPEPGTSASVRMSTVGGNAAARVEPLDKLPGKSNYFFGSVPERWHTGIPNYAKVRSRDVYPGIDMLYYGNQRQLEYDFVVRPDADPCNILLEFQGANKAELDRDGGLMMHTAAGDLKWHKPIAYQRSTGSENSSHARTSTEVGSSSDSNWLLMTAPNR